MRHVAVAITMLISSAIISNAQLPPSGKQSHWVHTIRTGADVSGTPSTIAVWHETLDETLRVYGDSAFAMRAIVRTDESGKERSRRWTVTRYHLTDAGYIPLAENSREGLATDWTLKTFATEEPDYFTTGYWSIVQSHVFDRGKPTQTTIAFVADTVMPVSGSIMQVSRLRRTNIARVASGPRAGQSDTLTTDFFQPYGSLFHCTREGHPGAPIVCPTKWGHPDSLLPSSANK